MSDLIEADDSGSLSYNSFNREEVANFCKTSLDFLAALAMPEVFKYNYPEIFLSLWAWITEYSHKERDFSQLALALPRGFGKSTVMKLFILYCILFTNKKFILIFTANATLSENIVADVIDMLNEPNIISVFGDWKVGVEKDTQAIKKFGFRGRNIVLYAMGNSGSVRGINMKNERPDVMIFDDIQTRENAESAVLSSELERWFYGTAQKAKSHAGCLFLFVGNMYPTKHSMMVKLKKNPNWMKYIVGAILDTGESIWEELQPISQLLNEYNNDLLAGHPEIFYAEVLNDENAVSNNFIDLSRLPPKPYLEDDIPSGNFIVIDPATDKKNSDAVSIGYFETHENIPELVKVIEGRFSPSETIRKSIELALTHNCRVIAIESNAYQYTLKHWFEVICAQLGIVGIEPVEVYSGVISKNSRILSMFKSLLSGEIFIGSAAYTQTALQITGFNALKKDNTDGILDLLTYAPRVIELYGHLITSIDVIQEQEYNSIPILEYNTIF